MASASSGTVMHVQSLFKQRFKIKNMSKVGEFLNIQQVHLRSGQNSY